MIGAITILVVVSFVFTNANVKPIKPPTLRWDYGEEKGPKTWAKVFSPRCAGKQQSPIDIKTKDVMTKDTESPLKITKALILKDATLINTGPLLVINVKDPKTAPRIHGGGLPDTYKLAKVAFNWGSDNTKGSEHLIDGKSSPFEMKMIFVKEKYTTKAATLKDSEGIAIVSVNFEEMTYNKGFKSILKNIKSAKFQGESVVIPEIDLTSLVPDLSEFYRYKGSITVPSCNENVIWSIATKKLYMAPEQLAAFRSIYSSPRASDKMIKMIDNIREVQPLNGRPVYMFKAAKKLNNP